MVSLHLLQLAFSERKCLTSGKILYEVSCTNYINYVYSFHFNQMILYSSCPNKCLMYLPILYYSLPHLCLSLTQGLEYCEERYSQDLSGTAFPLRAQTTNTRLLSCQTIEKFRPHPDRDDSMNEG